MAYNKRKYNMGGSSSKPKKRGNYDVNTGIYGKPTPVRGPIARKGMETKMSPSDKMYESALTNMNTAMVVNNAMAEENARQNAIEQQRFQQQLMLMEARNQMLMQQNQLLQTKIEKTDLINSARTIPSSNQKAMNTPKRKGGSTKYRKGGGKKKMITIGGVMKHGGSCLPGGRYSKKRR
jgi:hypothetical protein